jgi:hypothetical protein
VASRSTVPARVPDRRQQVTVPPNCGHERFPLFSSLEKEDRGMRIWSTLLIAAPLAAGLIAAPAAQADSHHRDWHGAWHHHDHDNSGALAGAVLGLGAAAILGGVIAAQQPYYYAPPPPVVYAPPPPYAPGYYSPGY